MNATTPLFLTLLVLAINVALSCNNNCCDSDNCCESSSNNCCPQSSCCQTNTRNCPLSNCCGRCQAQCRTNTCVTQCKRDCCDKNQPDVSVEDENDRVVIVTAPGQTATATGTNTQNINTNVFNSTATVGINNTITNVNSINIPVNVSNVNVNEVHIVASGHSDHRQSGTEESTCIDKNCTTDVKYVKVPVPIPIPQIIRVPQIFHVPIRVPVPVPQPVPYPVVIRQPEPGCCVNFMPCVSYGCYPYNMACGSQCISPYQYTPTNPCPADGCNRRPYGISTACYGSYCQGNMVNCNSCSQKFYQTYEGFRQCRGCFYT